VLKNKLWQFIKQVSEAYGGDELEWLRIYAKDVVETHKEDLQEAIVCFECLTRGSPKKSLKTHERAFKTYYCQECGYRSPFCRFDLYNKCSNIKEIVLHGT